MKDEPEAVINITDENEYRIRQVISKYLGIPVDEIVLSRDMPSYLMKHELTKPEREAFILDLQEACNG